MKLETTHLDNGSLVKRSGSRQARLAIRNSLALAGGLTATSGLLAILALSSCAGSAADLATAHDAQALGTITNVRMTAVVPPGTVDPVAAVTTLKAGAAFANTTWGAKANINFVVDSTALIHPGLLSAPGVENCSDANLAALGDQLVGTMAGFMCSSAAGEASGPSHNALQLALSPNVLHEAGHYFGLNHVFSGAEFDANFAAQVTPQLNATPRAQRAAKWVQLTNQYFDGDGLSDTGTSTGSGIPVNLQVPPTSVQNTCRIPYTGQMRLPMSDGSTFVGSYTPDRTNIMSYFGFCNGTVPGQYNISPSQVNIINGTLFNGRQRHLLGPALNFQPWAQIPGATNLALGATSFNNRVFLSAVGTNSAVYVTSSPGPISAFNGWGPVGATADTPVSATTFNGQLYLLLKGGADHKIYYDVALPNQAFSGWQLVGGSTTTEINGTAFDNKLYLFTKGDTGDSMPYYNVELPGGPFLGWGAVGGGIADPIATTAFDNKLYMFVPGSGTGAPTSQLYYNYAPVQQPFVGWNPIPSTLDVQGGVTITPVGAVATTVFSGRIYLFARGSNNHLFFNSALPQQPFGSWYELPGGLTTNASPVATVLGNTLYVAAKDTGTGIFITSAVAM